MKKLLLLSTLALLLSGCGQDKAPEDDSQLMDMMGDENTASDEATVDQPTEDPYSSGPTEIPSDLVPNDEQ